MKDNNELTGSAGKKLGALPPIKTNASTEPCILCGSIRGKSETPWVGADNSWRGKLRGIVLQLKWWWKKL